MNVAAITGFVSRQCVQSVWSACSSVDLEQCELRELKTKSTGLEASNRGGGGGGQVPAARTYSFVSHFYNNPLIFVYQP